MSGRQSFIDFAALSPIQVGVLDSLLASARCEGEVAASKKAHEQMLEAIENVRVGGAK